LVILPTPHRANNPIAHNCVPLAFA
jgi:hypothetical protein